MGRDDHFVSCSVVTSDRAGASDKSQIPVKALKEARKPLLYTPLQPQTEDLSKKRSLRSCKIYVPSVASDGFKSVIHSSCDGNYTSELYVLHGLQYVFGLISLLGYICHI